MTSAPYPRPPALLALVAVGLAGCGQFIVGAQPGGWGEVLVGALPPGAVVVDARSPEQFAAGHVPGAASVHWTELTGFDADGLWALDPPEEVAALLGQRGVPPDAPVVIVGGGPEGWGDDGNLYWVLRYLGHDEVSVLDGGHLAWVAAGGEPATGGAAPPAREWTVDLAPDLEASSADVAAWDGVLLDVRSEEEWAEGHIPGATWYPWDSVYTDDGTLRPRDDLSAEFAGLGIDLDTPVAVYCAAGIRAGHTFLVLDALGVVDVRNYLGSWARWTAEGRPTDPGSGDAD